MRFYDRGCHGTRISNVEIGSFERKELFAANGQRVLQVGADHACSAGDQPLHAGVFFFSSAICFFSSRDLSPSRKFEMPSPRPRPSWGSFPAPNTTRMMAKITSNSGSPSEPNIQPPRPVYNTDVGSRDFVYRGGC